MELVLTVGPTQDDLDVEPLQVLEDLWADMISGIATVYGQRDQG